jgi:chemotaxis protein CheZ
MAKPKAYRIEGQVGEGMTHEAASRHHAEIMAALASLRDLIEPAQSVSSTLLEEHRRDLQEALRLKVEMDSIVEAIQRTKREIATLHYAGTQGHEMARVTDELGAVVMGTEAATNSILAAAEKVDELAGNLAARLSGDDREFASEISNQVIGIFEACNFQDITGQRISKVVSAMRFIEERVTQMVEIWGGLESFKEVQLVEDVSRSGDQALINGPPLDQDEGRTSQDDIDALFG